MIVVGVDHAGKDRAHEYLPYKDFVGSADMAEPAGKRFPDFLTREVMPLVNGQYRTLTGPAEHRHRRLVVRRCGRRCTRCSRGPARFGYGLIESPTLWVGMGQLVRDTQPARGRCRSRCSWASVARRPTTRVISED